MEIFLSYFANKRNTFQIKTSEFQWYILCFRSKYFVIVFFDNNEKALFEFLELKALSKTERNWIKFSYIIWYTLPKFPNIIEKIISFGDNIR